MSDNKHDQKKKDGHDKNKQNEAMHDAVRLRHKQHEAEDGPHEEGQESGSHATKPNQVPETK